MRLSRRAQTLLGAVIAAAATTCIALPAVSRHEQLFGTGETSETFRSSVPLGPR